MPMEAERRSTVTDLLMSNLGAIRKWVVNANPRPHYTQGKDWVPTVEGAG